MRLGYQPVLVANLTISDDHITAVVGAPAAHRLVVATHGMVMTALCLRGNDGTSCKTDDRTGSDCTGPVPGVCLGRGNGDGGGGNCCDCNGCDGNFTKHNGSSQLVFNCVSFLMHPR